jgi:hypothetical protein
LSAFNKYITSGDSEPEAAWCALYDWDILEYEPQTEKLL